jgi:hypothetical protein
MNLRISFGDVVGNIDQRGDVNGKLSQNGWDDVHVEDVGLWPFLREPFNRLIAY